ncbi:MAG TPA: DUF2243 domain-containing protein [Noviherbaspirillum sp.]|jgi:uncharacterized membrane protein|uniref:DUF2243 domain-containing protein n=1 Tax=Noviherbaspirillum sp. TaxID=1926288 RepID=UPI002DDD2E99|nr:DUF2243 domain-containing protein [Noviherbaspirillum sp.]HEV2610213.1 DUF2243 domain-containing protein [Noviherbaspirillum sp.]
MHTLPSALERRIFNKAGYLTGFALGGFFDGILLHQVLQWHHLLSAVDRAPFGDLRMQVLADGLFHAAMYVIALIGIWMMIRSRTWLARNGSGRLLIANALIGFGAWHVVDAVLSHWLTGIHRIRMDSPNPLFWDLLWFAVFGILFIIAGIALRRRAGLTEGRGGTIASILAAITAAGAAASALPPSSADLMPTATVLLRPGASPAQLLAALEQNDARIVWNSARGDVWVFALGKNSNASAFYRHGAIFVSGTLLPAGCASFLSTRRPEGTI